jgi:hypothetical protein
VPIARGARSPFSDADWVAVACDHRRAAAHRRVVMAARRALVNTDW